MSKAWPRMKLGDVIRRIERSEIPLAGKQYRQIGVKLWGEGAYERESLDGGTTKYTKLFRTEANDIIVNKIWARNGSVALVPQSLDGCFGSGEFPMYLPDHNRLNPRWIHWLTKTRDFWVKCDEKSQGTSGKNRIKPERFLDIEISLPPLSEQRRIVERIDNLSAQINKARNLHVEIAREIGVLWVSIVENKLLGLGEKSHECNDETAESLLRSSSNRYSGLMANRFNNAHPGSPDILKKGPHKLPEGWIWTTLGSVVTHLVDCVNDTPDFREDNTGYLGLKSTNVRPYLLDLTQKWFMSPEDFNTWNRRVQPVEGDILLTREAPMGYACMLPSGLNVCLTQRLILLRPDGLIMLPRLLLHYLNSTIFSSQVCEHCRGLTTPHIRVQDAPKFLLPLPPSKEQHRLVAELDSLQVEMDMLKYLQGESICKLDSFIPAILNNAFGTKL